MTTLRNGKKHLNTKFTMLLILRETISKKAEVAFEMETYYSLEELKKVAFLSFFLKSKTTGIKAGLSFVFPNSQGLCYFHETLRFLESVPKELSVLLFMFS
jgi:hypothetical protein